jgi:hypothetical protein
MLASWQDQAHIREKCDTSSTHQIDTLRTETDNVPQSQYNISDSLVSRGGEGRQRTAIPI